jgi:gamma-glutamyltranspeptidase/glutathione hydrolase
MTEFTTRPVIMGSRGVVTSGHYLATAAGFRIMEDGGNAVDAAAAMSFCVNLLEPQMNGIGGEVPTLIYSARDSKTYAVSGVGWSPGNFSIEWCQKNGIEAIPGDGYLPACVPSAVDTWAVALARFGTMTMTQVLRPVIELAEGGYPLDPELHEFLSNNKSKFETHYPTTAQVYYPDGKVPSVGDMMHNIDLANVLKSMCAAEEKAGRMNRIAGIEAARDVFYKGPVAEKIVEFITNNPVEDATGKANRGLLSYEDIAEWHATVEDPVTLNYRGLDVYKCPTWTQGPVFLQQLGILEGFELSSMEHNSSDYLHILIETAKLAFADREVYYGDPLFDEVPLGELLSSDYSRERKGMIGNKASLDFRPGDVGKGIRENIYNFDQNAVVMTDVKLAEKDFGLGGAHLGDTTHLDAADREGNMVAATPSGGWIGTSPVIRGLGFPLGTRGQMFYLDPNRANALEPRKRPRATLTPSIVTRGKDPLMAFGTPGGDGQDQWTLQYFLNQVEFGMNIQEAIDAPTVTSLHFPSSFYPRDAYPGRVVVESRVPEAVRNELENRGHEVIATGPWTNGKVMGVSVDTKRGLISGGASPRRHSAYAIGW